MNSDDKTHKYIKKLLAVPYLPAEHINTVFIALQEKAVTEPPQELTTYISNTWLNSSIWPITSRSVFGHYTRTKNDVEGWHLIMNNKAKKGQLSFYILIRLLHEEAATDFLQVWLVSESKLSQCVCQKYCKSQAAIFKAWDNYTNGHKSANQLLKACSKHVSFLIRIFWFI